jgi:hypothetical protein
MREQSNEAHLRQLAAETILEISGLTDNLTDEEARPLIAWGLSQAESAVHQVVATSQTVDMLPQDDLTPVLTERLGPVRRVMKAINSLTADRFGLSPGELAGELAYIQDLAQKLPSPPPLAAADIAVGDLPARQASLDNSAFVSAMLSMLGSEPASRPQDVEAGVEAAGAAVGGSEPASQPQELEQSAAARSTATTVSSEPAPQPQEPEQGARPVSRWRRWAASLCRKQKNSTG